MCMSSRCSLACPSKSNSSKLASEHSRTFRCNCHARISFQVQEPGHESFAHSTLTPARPLAHLHFHPHIPLTHTCMFTRTLLAHSHIHLRILLAQRRGHSHIPLALSHVHSDTIPHTRTSTRTPDSHAYSCRFWLYNNSEALKNEKIYWI